jgi:hypothetical protein
MNGEERGGFGNSQNSQNPMTLKENFEDEENREILKILQDFPKFKRTLSSLAYFTEKRKKNSSHRSITFTRR